jgi:transposase
MIVATICGEGQPAIRALCARHPRLHLERFPAYAPELNPDEQVWNHFKGRLANSCPMTIDELLADLTHLARTTRHTPALLRSFILAADVPPLLAS